VITDSPPADLTSPISEPFPDIIQDLAQLSDVTPSYLAVPLPVQFYWQPEYFITIRSLLWSRHFSCHFSLRFLP
jgi:hypothetical protein